MRSAEQLKRDALAIWRAAVEAVRADRLVEENVVVEEDQLVVDGEVIDLKQVRRIVVVGAGKAGAGMAAGLEAALGEQVLQEKNVTGWVNVPEDCVCPLRTITLHGARPAGVNEPTLAGVEGTQRILQLVQSLGPQDLCFCLISGGGSALLPAPVTGVSLADKQAITRFLSGAGANIQQLNTVRKQLSQIKGGGLARACRAGRMITLVISDVIGDPLDVIASGPTVPDSSSPADALKILRQFGADAAANTSAVFEYLEQEIRKRTSSTKQLASTCIVSNYVIGNNAVAVDGAGIEAVSRGYSPALWAARELEGDAEDVGRHLAAMAIRMSSDSGPDCLITGGEPIVRLVPAAERGKGGRNQQLVLAAWAQLPADARQQIVILSGGTDGEDGPTDAAGAIAAADTFVNATHQQLDAEDFLRRNDAYHFFAPLNGLIKTGPTHTNVCDIRVVVVARVQTPLAE